MSKNVKWLVITGGPCSGKTTGMSKCCQALRNRGYKVIVIPETATMLINSGIPPTSLDTIDFQDLIFDIQKSHEEIWERGVKKLPNEDVIILLDRGIMDNKAYMTDEEFSSLLAKYHTSERELIERYDAAIHLVTAANGAESYYTLETNEARKETPEQARQLDITTLKAWDNHPYHKIIDNAFDPSNTKNSFEQKMDKLLNSIFEILQIPYYDGNKKKYLVKMPDINMLKYFVKCTESMDVIHYLVPNESSIERRIVQQKYQENFVYSYMEKRKNGKKDTIVIEKNLTPQEFLSLLIESDDTMVQVRRNRYCFTFEDRYFELSIYPNLTDKAVLTVIQDDDKEEISLPEFVTIIEDVSYDEKYDEINMSKSFINKN